MRKSNRKKGGARMTALLPPERRRAARARKRRELLRRLPVETLVLATGTLFFLIAPKRAANVALAPFVGRNFAHRGLHTADKSIPENSLAAFDAACRKGYGSELDVQLSSDGKVFVFHDDLLDRVTGTAGVAEYQPWSALKDLKLCGTDETIPLFEDVLKTVDGRAPLIVELKSTERYPELCEKTLDFLLASREETGLDFCVESFDPRIVKWFKDNAPLIVRGQLSAPTENRNRSGNSSPSPVRTSSRTSCRVRTSSPTAPARSRSRWRSAGNSAPRSSSGRASTRRKNRPPTA